MRQKKIETNRQMNKTTVVHCKQAKYDVYIGRPSKWGNPFKIGRDGTREEVIRKYEKWLLTQRELLDSLPELVGKVLGCWCVNNPVGSIRTNKICHGEVLLNALRIRESMHWAYVAGFLDGDGWVTSSANKNCQTRKYTIGFTQHSREEKVMRKIRRFMRYYGIRVSWITRVVGPRCKIKSDAPMINLHIKEQESVIRFLKHTLPYINIKKDIATECYVYTKHRMTKMGRGLQAYKQEKNKLWSEDEVSKLLSLHKKGYNNKAIGIKMFRSPDSISHKLYKLKIRRNS